MPSACFTFPLGQFQRPARSFYLVREDFGAVHADGIVSSDIVGYSTDSLTSGKFNMGGITFTTVGGDDIDLNDVTFNNLTKGDEADNADKIQVWNPGTSGYTTYYFYNAEGDEDNWGWVDENWEVPDATLAVGTAFWYKAKPGSDKSMTVSGALESADDVTVNLTGGKFNMVISPFPSAIDLNNTKTVVITNYTPGDEADNADKVQVWNPATSGYTTYYYYNAEGDEDNWGWVDENWELPDASLAAGTAFWYKAKTGTGKSIKFINPTK